MSKLNRNEEAELSDDESDEDYVPENEPESDKEDEKELQRLHKRKLGKEDENEIDECESNSDDSNSKLKKKNSSEVLEMSEAEKKKADDLLPNFLKDTKTTLPSKPISSSLNQTDVISKSENKNDISKSNNSQSSSSSNQPSKTNLFDSSVGKVDADSNGADKLDDLKNKNSLHLKQTKPSGMASLLSKLNKEPKISTLQKSKLDWDEFKKKEKIEHDLAIHTKGKESYLERKAFLERADLRQFELEKEMRAKERKLREQK